MDYLIQLKDKLGLGMQTFLRTIIFPISDKFHFDHLFKHLVQRFMLGIKLSVSVSVSTIRLLKVTPNVVALEDVHLNFLFLHYSTFVNFNESILKIVQFWVLSINPEMLPTSSRDATRLSVCLDPSSVKQVSSANSVCLDSIP